ncbi:MAG: hypothetical protein HYX26_00395 [Acidobacteriales bacterium]|nr:hypothetical protein [Terriglobales bacterium]
MSNTMRTISLATVMFLMLCGIAPAHGGGGHVKGTVTAITADSITVKTPAGESKSVHFDQSTVFEKSKVKATVKDLKTGDRVVVDVQETGDKLHATQVRFGAQPQKTAAKSGHDH